MHDDSATETWKSIPGWVGYYEASDLGRIRSVPRRVPDGRPNVPYRWLKGRVLSPTHVGSGYLRVTLTRGNKKFPISVHRAVLAAFTGSWPGEELQGCHNDGDKNNNRLDNLRWDTASENARDQIRHGTHVAASKTECSRGHMLAGPNLIEAYNILRDGTKSPARECLACRKANNFLNNGRRTGPRSQILPDRDLLADAYYASIMRSV